MSGTPQNGAWERERRSVDGKASVSLYAKDGMVWMNQNQIARLFDTSVPNISMHISNILKEGELEKNSIVKNYFTTATDGIMQDLLTGRVRVPEAMLQKYQTVVAEE